MWLKKFIFSSWINIAARGTTCAKRLLFPLLSQPVRHLRTTGNVYANGRTSYSFDRLNPFGKVVIKNNTPFVVNYFLTCINPRDYPDQDKAFTTVSHDNIITCRLYNNVLSINDAAEAVPSESDIQKTPFDCQIEVPVKFDIVAELSGTSSISISNFENATVNVELHEGRCLLSNIQTGQFHVSSHNGTVISEKLLQGNGVITANGGVVSLHKVLSQVLYVQSQTGDVNITNLYANTSKISTEKGDIHIVNSHMDTDLTIRKHGNIKIGSVSGCLNADVHQGDVTVMISEHGKIALSTQQGDITISLPRTLSTTLEVTGTMIQTDKELLLKNVLEEKRNGLELLDAVVEGTATHHTSPGRILACSGKGKVTLLSSSDGWLSMIRENLKKE